MPLSRIQKQARGSGQVLHALDNLAGVIDRHLARKQATKDKTEAQQYAEDLWFRQQERLHKYRKELTRMEAAEEKGGVLSQKQINEMVFKGKSFNQWKNSPEAYKMTDLYAKEETGISGEKKKVLDEKGLEGWEERAFIKYLQYHYNPYISDIYGSGSQQALYNTKVIMIAKDVSDLIKKQPDWLKSIMANVSTDSLTYHPITASAFEEVKREYDLAGLESEAEREEKRKTALAEHEAFFKPTFSEEQRYAKMFAPETEREAKARKARKTVEFEKSKKRLTAADFEKFVLTKKAKKAEEKAIEAKAELEKVEMKERLKGTKGAILSTAWELPTIKTSLGYKPPQIYSPKVYPRFLPPEY